MRKATTIVILLFATQVFCECPPGYDPRPGTQFCYRLLDTASKAGDAAETDCQNLASAHPGLGNLATVSDYATWEWIKTFYASRLAAITNGVSNSLWIGLYDAGVFDFAWRDGTPFCLWSKADRTTCGPFLKWGSGKPNGPKNEQKCGILIDGAWDDKPCSDTYDYLCQYKRSSPTDPCPSDYTEYNDGFCYWLKNFLLRGKNANDAEAGCQASASGLPGKANLATIKDQTTLDWILQTFSTLISSLTTKEIWIGLQSDGLYNYSWKEAPNKVYARKNGFWKFGKPNDVAANDQQCVIMTMQSDAEFDDKECSNALPYICQYKIFQKGWAYIVPMDNGCVTTQSALGKAPITKNLFDKNISTCTTTSEGRIFMIALADMYRGIPTVVLQGRNIPCNQIEGPVVSLNLICTDCEKKSMCYPGVPASDNGLTDCFYRCDFIAARIDYVNILFHRNITNQELCEVYLANSG